MDEYDRKMESVVSSYQAKRMLRFSSIAVFLFIINEHCINKEPLEGFKNLLYTLVTTGLVYSTSKAIEYCSGWNPLFLTNFQSDLIKLNKIRETLLPLKDSIENLKTNAEKINKFKVCQCYELCIVTYDVLSKLEGLSGKFITQLALRSESNTKHTHTIIVVSSEKLPNVIGKTIGQLSMPELIFVDPLYGFIKWQSEIKNEQEKFPLLSYSITGIDIEARASNVQESMREAPKK